ADGDEVPLDAAPAAGTRSVVNANQPPDAAADKRVEEASNGQQEQQPTAADTVAPLSGDDALGQIATAVGDSHVYAAIQAVADGKDGLASVETIAQVMGK